jgi:two-component system phosphate regulon sensor histidine kinase PhoR
MSNGPLLELTTLAAQLEVVREQLAAAVGPAVEPIVDEALEGLRTSVEELRVAEEDLREQNDELAAAQVALELERARLRSLFDEAPDAYLVTDEHARIVVANLPSERIFGLELSFVLGKPMAVLVAQQDRRSFRTFVAHARVEPTEPLVARVARRDGVLLWAEFKASARGGPDGQELRWVVRDVTDRVQAEQRLWELNAELEWRVEERTAELDAERARLEGLLRELPVGVLILDAKTQRIQAANARAAELLGPEVATAAKAFRALDVLRSATGERISPRDFPSAVTARTGERTLATRYRLDTPRGTLPVEISTSAVLDEDGVLASIVLTIEDVTMRERLERADHDFVSNAAHQLRTPLTAIASAIAVLQAGAKDVPGERDRFLAHLERETDRLARLGRALLTLARAQRGESEPDSAVVPIRPLLDALAANARSRDGIHVSVECAADVAVLANPELLEEALSNLVTNAVQYTRGDVELRADALDGVARIDVRDTGRGIAAADRARVFERFYRAGGSSPTAGFGLGLPIAKAAVEAMEGSIEIVSTGKRGTTFRVCVPAARLVQ